jgi:hypothetical protein
MGPLSVAPGLVCVDGVLRLSEADDDRLLVHRNDVQRVGEQQQNEGGDHTTDDKGTLHGHCP